MLRARRRLVTLTSPADDLHKRTPIPLHFIWGMADPVSGAPVAEHIRTRVPNTHLLALDAVGHYPHVEVPDRVLAELRTLL